MSDAIAERLEKRRALAASVEQAPELFDLVGADKDETVANLDDAHTVPELKEHAENLGVDISGLNLKAEIAGALAAFMLRADEIVEKQAEEPGAEAPTTAESDGAGPAPDVGVQVPDLSGEDPRPIEGGGEYVRVAHVTRLLVGPKSNSADGKIRVTAEMLSDHLFQNYFSKGYHLLYAEHLGIDTDGHWIIWGLGLPNDSDADMKQSEVHPIVRTIGAGEQAVSEFNAATYVSAFLSDGWELFSVRQLGLGPSGINMLWVLVR